MTSVFGRFATSALLVGGILVVGGPPASGSDLAVNKPLMKAKCHSGFRKKRRALARDWAHAYDYYEARRKAVQASYDNLRWLLADPEAHDLIPTFEQSAAKQYADYLPVIAAQRDEKYNGLKAFRAEYLKNGCLPGKKSKATFTAGTKYWRTSLGDIYAAHGRLFRALLALQTAQADLAGQHLTDADMEEATVGENFQHAMDRFDTLLG